eukprot:992950-Pelagomonas_calceolata.AAC.3
MLSELVPLVAVPPVWAGGVILLENRQTSGLTPHEWALPTIQDLCTQLHRVPAAAFYAIFYAVDHRLWRHLPCVFTFLVVCTCSSIEWRRLYPMLEQNAGLAEEAPDAPGRRSQARAPRGIQVSLPRLEAETMSTNTYRQTADVRQACDSTGSTPHEVGGLLLNKSLHAWITPAKVHKIRMDKHTKLITPEVLPHVVIQDCTCPQAAVQLLRCCCYSAIAVTALCLHTPMALLTVMVIIVELPLIKMVGDKKDDNN